MSKYYSKTKMEEFAKSVAKKESLRLCGLKPINPSDDVIISRRQGKTKKTQITYERHDMRISNNERKRTLPSLVAVSKKNDADPEVMGYLLSAITDSDCIDSMDVSILRDDTQIMLLDDLVELSDDDICYFVDDDEDCMPDYADIYLQNPVFEHFSYDTRAFTLTIDFRLPRRFFPKPLISLIYTDLLLRESVVSFATEELIAVAENAFNIMSASTKHLDFSKPEFESIDYQSRLNIAVNIANEYICLRNRG